jgi:CsoR family transcriptional regulator, copper-sensing transcriptional repressor
MPLLRSLTAIRRSRCGIRSSFREGYGWAARDPTGLQDRVPSRTIAEDLVKVHAEARRPPPLLHLYLSAGLLAAVSWRPAVSVYFQTMRGYTQDKDAYLRRLRRIEGQVRGLQRMVEDDTYCIDVLTQISAATRALQAVAVGLLQDHLGHCVTEAVEQGGPEAEAKVKEAAEAVARLVRS